MILASVLRKNVVNVNVLTKEAGRQRGKIALPAMIGDNASVQVRGAKAQKRSNDLSAGY
jgi:hypothetical protein